jgi:hypothetical protein
VSGYNERAIQLELTQNVPNVGANGIRPYDTIEVITFLCVSPVFDTDNDHYQLAYVWWQ